MKLTILGSGSPEAYARRASSGYLLEVAGQRILFDCGGGVVSRLVEAGFRPSDIDYLFFTHLHSDHMMDYARLVHAAWDEGGKPLKVFGPEPIKDITEKLFGRDGVFAHDLIARTELKGSQEVWIARGGTLPRPWPAPEVTEIEPGFTFEGDSWSLASCSVPHAQPYLTCMAFSVTGEGEKFVYSGDAGLTDQLEVLAKDADLLLHWCYRLSDDTNVSQFMCETAPTPPEIASVAERAGVCQLILTHFRVHMDESDRHKQALKNLRDGFSGKSGIAEDLEVYSVSIDKSD
ncbi:MAG: MBL fold metallo-hydrolase [Pseudomonadota bacterium]